MWGPDNRGAEIETLKASRGKASRGEGYVEGVSASPADYGPRPKTSFGAFRA